MPSAKIEVPLKYIGGKPHYRGDIMSFTVAEWNALSANDKVGLQITDFSDLLQQMVVQEVATGGGGGGGGTPTTVFAPANVIPDADGNTYEDWHITWAGGDMNGFQAAQIEADVIAAYPEAVTNGNLSIYLVRGHLDESIDHNAISSMLGMSYLQCGGFWMAMGPLVTLTDTPILPALGDVYEVGYTTGSDCGSYDSGDKVYANATPDDGDFLYYPAQVRPYIRANTEAEMYAFPFSSFELPLAPLMVMSWYTDTVNPVWDSYGLDPGDIPAGDYTLVIQHSPTNEVGQYKPKMLEGMEFSGGSVQTSTSGGGGVNISDAYKGPWVAGPYNKGDLVNRNGSLYVADTSAAEGDDPAAAGVPVDIGGYGGRPDAESYTGSDTEHWTQFTVGPAGARVSEIEVWVALLNAPTVPVGAKVGIYSADRTQVISIVTLPGGPWSGDDSIRGQLPDIVDLAPDTTYSICAYGNRIGVNNGGPYVPDGVVTAIGESATTYYGVTTAWAVPFRLYGPADIDGPWRRLVKGLP